MALKKRISKWLTVFKHVPFEWWFLYLLVIILSITLNILIYLARTKNYRCFCINCPKKQHITNFTLDDMTYVSVPRCIKNQDTYIKYKLAISSWLSSSPSARVILFINKTEFHSDLPSELDALFGPDRVLYANYLRSDSQNVPYLDQWFEQGINLCQTKYITFINTDILLSSSWFPMIKKIFNLFETKFPNKKPFIIGERIDFDFQMENMKYIRFSQKSFLKDIDQMVKKSPNSLHSMYGMDTFTFMADDPPFPVTKFPPYLIGRYNWDNWFIGWLNTIADTITLLYDPPVYHINHNRHDFNINVSRVAVNHFLKKANNNYFGSNGDVKWQIQNGYLKRRHSKEKYFLGDEDD